MFWMYVIPSWWRNERHSGLKKAISLWSTWDSCLNALWNFCSLLILELERLSAWSPRRAFEKSRCGSCSRRQNISSNNISFRKLYFFPYSTLLLFSQGWCRIFRQGQLSYINAHDICPNIEGSTEKWLKGFKHEIRNHCLASRQPVQWGIWGIHPNQAVAGSLGLVLIKGHN